MSKLTTFTLKVGFKRNLQMNIIQDNDILYEVFQDTRLLDIPSLIQQFCYHCLSDMTDNVYFVWDKNQWREWASNGCIKTFLTQTILRDGQLKTAIEKKSNVCFFSYVCREAEPACTANDIFYWDEEDKTWGRIIGSRLTPAKVTQKSVSRNQYLARIFGV